MRRIRLIVVAALLAVVGIGVAGCAPAAEQVPLSADTVIVDVRTPAEYASGHLDGALNINWEGNFKQEIAALPKDGTYLLYCRSGNRAGQAEAAMKALGYTNVTNIGSVQQASDATGIPVVK